MRIVVGHFAQKICQKSAASRISSPLATKGPSLFLLLRGRIPNHGLGPRVDRQSFATKYNDSNHVESEQESESTAGSRGARTRSRNSERTVKTPREKQNQHAESLRMPGVVKTDERTKKSKSVKEWLAELEVALPNHLKESPSTGKVGWRTTKQGFQHGVSRSSHTPGLVLSVLQKAARWRVDLLSFIGVEQNRWKAVLWITEMLLHSVANLAPDTCNMKTPSNLAWGTGYSTFNSLTREPFSVEVMSSSASQQTYANTTLELDPRHHNLVAHKNQVMGQIWFSVGSLIIEAAELPEDEAEVIMAVVYQIIAQIHALGLVPDDVYSYTSSNHTAMVQRPPILYLLSSRILTTLSDATWRSHQMEIIEQAVNRGTPLRNLVKDLPGGRFRLKVRPLGPEVWLEFVLWCCVEGGFTIPGSRIIDLVQAKTKNPWFAVPWTSRDANNLSEAINWDLVRSRHGGPVGLIEGYNREAPFVEMAPRTVSAEVILALVQSCVELSNGDKGRHRLSRTIFERVPRLLGFLEPHSLPSTYFDFLCLRVLQSDLFEDSSDASLLELWAQKMAEMRSLETRMPPMLAGTTFKVEDIVKQSEVHAGILHQAMEGFVDIFDVRNAAVVFNAIQKHVDESKLQSISSFLATTSAEHSNYINERGLFTSHMSDRNIDFLESHGQLPLHKLAAFLNLATDSKLLRIGQWLLYSDDVDEPVIPKQLYGKPGLTASLIRFARVSRDQELLKELVLARKQALLKPSVSLLRSLVDAFISTYDFREAYQTLEVVKKAKGGGYGLSNLTSAAVVVLELEAKAKDSENHEANVMYRQALILVDRMLRGEFDNRGGDFRVDVDLAYRQQIAALLTIFSQLHWSRINQLSHRWWSKYPMHNLTTLSTDMFNSLLMSVINIKGSPEAMRLAKIFCQRPLSTSRTIGHRGSFDEYPAEDGVAEEDDVVFSKPGDRFASVARVQSGEYIPFVDLDHNPGRDPLLLDETDKPELELDLPLDELSFDNAFPVLSDEKQPFGYIEPRGLVEPDLRTLRIIVRGALAEKTRLRTYQQDVSQQNEVLRWATAMYRQFQIPTKVIEQEIQQAVAEIVPNTHPLGITSSSEFRFIAGSQKRPKKRQLYEPFRKSRPMMGGNEKEKRDRSAT